MTYHQSMILERCATVPTVTLKAKLFRGFADPSRLSILEALRVGSQPVGELVDLTGLSQSNTSNHLACLLDCGLVVRERRGRFVYYCLAEGVDSLLAAADELLDGAGQPVAACPTFRAAEP